MQDTGFDILTDLRLTPNESFNWENKATSLYCIVAGNLSDNLRTIQMTLSHLSRFYQGVFYMPGTLEFETADTISNRIDALKQIISSIPNACMLHHFVATVDGIAVIGINGFSGDDQQVLYQDLMQSIVRDHEFEYLRLALQRLQRHLDIKKIIVVSGAIPHDDLYFHEKPVYAPDQTPLCDVLLSDTEKKVSHWVFGGYNKSVDTTLSNVNYINNPKSASPYYAKRLTLSI